MAACMIVKVLESVIFVKSTIAPESQLIGEIPVFNGNTLDYPPPCSVMDPHLVLEPKSIARINL